MIVGRCDLQGRVVFDDGDEVVIENEHGLPVEIVVADQMGTFADYRTELEHFAARICRRRSIAGSPLLADPEEFAACTSTPSSPGSPRFNWSIGSASGRSTRCSSIAPATRRAASPIAGNACWTACSGPCRRASTTSTHEPLIRRVKHAAPKDGRVDDIHQAAPADDGSGRVMPFVEAAEQCLAGRRLRNRSRAAPRPLVAALHTFPFLAHCRRRVYPRPSWTHRPTAAGWLKDATNGNRAGARPGKTGAGRELSDSATVPARLCGRCPAAGRPAADGSAGVRRVRWPWSRRLVHGGRGRRGAACRAVP